MSGQFGQVAFIVWRESVEALLVVGILAAWLDRTEVAEVARRARLWLWGGVAAGLATAAGLAVVLMFFADLLGDEGQDWFQIGMVLLASMLILQMIAWMRRHGRTLKRDLEQDLAAATARASGIGVFVLALIAVAREGSETVVFLWGTFAGSAGQGGLLGATLSAIGGLVAALATWGVLQYGGRRLSWRTFFRVTEVMLLLLGLALFTTGVDRLVGLDVLPQLSRPLWNTGALLDDGAGIGSFLATLTGYRARPDLTTLLAWGAYALIVVAIFARGRAAPAAHVATGARS